MIALTQEEFIRKAKEVHGDKFDYSKVIYIRSDDKVIIICPIDGEFEQRPRHHLFGNSCPKCAARNTTMRPRSNVEEFIQKAKVIHHDKYDYSKVDYTYSWSKVTIICPVHGEFEQRPSSHLSGYGCIKCGIIGNTLSQEEFIHKAQMVHNNKYDYSKVVYIYSQTKIIIICPEHGEFEQKPSDHLMGFGCSNCSGIKQLTTETFIKRAKEVHGNKYDYTKVRYINTHNKVIIICPKHGEFEQRPNSHLNGRGCPRCNRSKGELAIETILDKHNIESKQEYKIPEVVNEFEYDFYLPDYNLLIEFHGIQHFKAIEFFGGEDTLTYTRRNDEIKKYHAYKFKYRFIEFNYKQLKQLSKEQFEKLVINSILKYKKIK